MRKRRVIFLATVALVASACGLGVVGALSEPPPGADAGPDAPVALDGAAVDGGDGATDEDGATDFPFPYVDAAGLDVNPANCAPECTGPGRSCDGGYCFVDCKANGACTGAPVVCPPGIPCVVQCGDNACGSGIDCTAATACELHCNGNPSCNVGAVRCAGLYCNLGCEKDNACKGGVSCDAGTCQIECLGNPSCTGGAIACASDVCTIDCAKDNACTSAGSLACAATTSCAITCNGNPACNEEVTAIAGQAANVACIKDNSCTAGVLVSAADGGILCKGGGSICGGGIRCDGGACLSACAGAPVIQGCCAAEACDYDASGGCKITDSGCP